MEKGKGLGFLAPKPEILAPPLILYTIHLHNMYALYEQLSLSVLLIVTLLVSQLCMSI